MDKKGQKVLLFSVLLLSVLTAAFFLSNGEKTIRIKLERVPIYTIIKDHNIFLGLDPSSEDSFEKKMGGNRKFEEINDGFCREFSESIGIYRLCQTGGLYGDRDNPYYDEAQWLEIKPHDLKLSDFLKGREELEKVYDTKSYKIYISSTLGEKVHYDRGNEYMTLNVARGKINKIFWIKR